MSPVPYPLYLIPLLPILGAATNLLVGKRLGKNFATAIALSSVAGSCLLGWLAAVELWHLPGAVLHDTFFSAAWIHAVEPVGGASLDIAAGLLLDRLSAVVVLVTTTVGFLIHLYSTAYMDEDEGYARYFGYLNLFTGAMLVLVLGDSLPITFIGWEGVGVSSYLLIGFWFTDEANATAGRKAFIVNRVGDVCFLLGMFLLFHAASTLNYQELAGPEALAALGKTAFGTTTYATVGALLLFFAATGKSAQLPLYVWLPDAMAGPTPVSALMHAATMVTAGVYLVARLHVLFAAAPFVMGFVAVVGALTALFAATMGIVQKPIKKILAYSTISQIGFMVIGVGTGAYEAGVFHLVTHALFKAGLFLAAGAIMHALHNESDVTKMGGLRKKMPITHVCYLIYCLAISGIPPFSGFFSKDAILAGAFGFDYATLPGWPHWLGHAVYAVGLVAAICTAFYMFRSYFLVFWGDFRGDHHLYDHAHEAPPAMAWPLILLAGGSVLIGFIGIPEVFGEHLDFFGQWLEPVFPVVEAAHLVPAAEWALMGVAVVAAMVGIGAAFALYGRGLSPTAERLATGAGGLYRLVFNKYYVDEAYDFLFVRPLRRLSQLLWKVVDAFFIDTLLVRGSAAVVDVVGRLARLVQNGDVQRGLVGMTLGTAGIVAVAVGWTAFRASAFTATARGNEITIHARGTSAKAQCPLEYTFDFGDGTVTGPQASPVASHAYDAATVGEKHRIAVTVRDPQWGTQSSERRSVVFAPAAATGGGGAPTEANSLPVKGAAQ